jgi:hypothetical protein
MHIYTHLTPQWKGKNGLGVYADGMVEHDTQVGQLLAELKKLGIADNTIVVYTTDNGAELLLWPDGGMIPFHGEKNTTWDGGEDYPRWRVDNAWAFMPAQMIVAQFLQSFREFPPRAKPGSFSLDQALQKMQQPSNN